MSRPSRPPANPFAFFQTWFRQARRADPLTHNAMVLATSGVGGAPSARVVLLKSADPLGFVFFTNHGSRKGVQLARQPKVALVFYWKELKRQVRIEGTVTRVTRAESEAYFATRPRESQLGAWASPQSQPLASRADLRRRYRAAAARFAGAAVPCPDGWGGYRVTPVRMEFWTDGLGRLHDRIEYRRRGRGPWTMRRLAP